MSLAPMSPPEENLLRALWNRGPLTRGAAKTDAETIRRLTALNLIEELPSASKRATPRLALTEAGRVAAAKLPPPNPTQLDVFRQVVAMREELEALRRLVETKVAPSPDARAKASGESPWPLKEAPMTLRSGKPESRRLSLEDFGRRTREAVLMLDRQERLGGLVPLPRLRDSLQGMGLTRAEFDDAMLALEEQFIIDLKVANDPSRLADADLGIATADRGLLYFVVAR